MALRCPYTRKLVSACLISTTNFRSDLTITQGTYLIDSCACQQVRLLDTFFDQSDQPSVKMSIHQFIQTLARFTNLRELHLRIISNEMDWRKVYEILNSSQFLPCLDLLEITNVDASFKYDRLACLNEVEFPRRRPKQQKRLHRTPYQPPAKQLVGIELNPGPPTQMNAQTLFADGLHSIFAFLDDTSFIKCVTRVCHSWHQVGSTSSRPNRSLAVVPRSADSLVRFRTGIKSPFRRHLTSIRFDFDTSGDQNPKPRPTSSDWSQFLSYLPSYPSLTELTFDQLPANVSFTSLSSCHSLTSLRLMNSYSLLIPFVTRLVAASYYTSFARIFELNSRNAKEMPPAALNEMNGFIAQMRIVAKMSQLTSLNIERLKGLPADTHVLLRLLQMKSICLPSVQRFALDRMALNEAYVECLVLVLPQLTHLHPQSTDSTAVSLLHRFVHLISIHINIRRFPWYDPTVLALTKLTQLRHIEFESWCPDTAEQYESLFSSLPRLDSLAFISAEQADLLELMTATEVNRSFSENRLRELTLYDMTLKKSSLSFLLSHFTSLRSLIITCNIGCKPFEAMEMVDLRQTFDSALVLPQLRYIHFSTPLFVYDLDQQMNTDTYRIK